MLINRTEIKENRDVRKKGCVYVASLVDGADLIQSFDGKTTFILASLLKFFIARTVYLPKMNKVFDSHHSNREKSQIDGYSSFYTI